MNCLLGNGLYIMHSTSTLEKASINYLPNWYKSVVAVMRQYKKKFIIVAMKLEVEVEVWKILRWKNRVSKWRNN